MLAILSGEGGGGAENSARNQSLPAEGGRARNSVEEASSLKCLLAFLNIRFLRLFW